MLSQTLTQQTGQAHPAPPADPTGLLTGVPRAIRWVGGPDGTLELLDQTLLPSAVSYLTCSDVATVHEAIRQLRVRGAPAIGVAAAFGVYLGVRGAVQLAADGFRGKVAETAQFLVQARPTAVNLAWAVRRVCDAISAAGADPAAGAAAALASAREIADEDAQVCARIGIHGAALVPDGGGVLTHCNAGALATAGIGTALAALYTAHAQGRRFRVFADETRPLLQGARLTAYELGAAGLDVTVICDSAAAHLLRSGAVQMVIVGADRIAANGDVANKVGTYSLAIAAAHHRVPFYVAAPRSTFDATAKSGADIPIEERSAAEVRGLGGRELAAPAARVWNPAFDVTPAGLVAGIVTEFGVLKPVSEGVVRGFLLNTPCKGPCDP